MRHHCLLFGLSITQLRLFKQGERLTPFRVGLLLALARIQRFEATCVTMIKQRVTEEFKLACLCSRSKWLNVQVRGVPSIPTCPQSHSPRARTCVLSGSPKLAEGAMTQVNGDEDMADVTPTLDVFNVLLTAVDHSAAGWDLITQAFVQLGLALLQAAKPRDLPLPSLGSSMDGPGTSVCALRRRDPLVSACRAMQLTSIVASRQIFRRRWSTCPVSQLRRVLAPPAAKCSVACSARTRWESSLWSR